MKTVFAVLTRNHDETDGDNVVERLKCIKTTLAAAMVAADQIKPSVVLEVSPKAGVTDRPIRRIEIS